MRRCVRSVLFVAILSLAVAGVSVPATAADAGIVFAAFQALKDNHVDNPDPIKLLRGAVEGLRQALTRAGIGGSIPDLAAATEAVARMEFQARFDRAVGLAQGKVEEAELQHAAASNMASSLGDSHTRFFPPQAFREFLQGLQGQPGYVGIGVLIHVKDGRYYVWYAFPGGPAARAGLKGFDRVLTVDGVSLQGMAQGDAFARVRGPQGTTVRIEVQRPGEPTPRSFSIVREAIAVPVLEYAMLERRVGYVRLISFSQGAATQLRRAFEDLKQQGMRGLVLDLRFNLGGLTSELNAIADLLLPSGVTAYIEQTRQGRMPRVTSGGSVLDPSMPVVLLINEATESAGEALSAAVKDNGRATAVGAKTAGFMQRTRYLSLPGGAGIGVPIARVFSPKGVDLEGEGVSPDVPLDLTIADLDRGTDAQLQRGVELLLQRVGQQAWGRILTFYFPLPEPRQVGRRVKSSLVTVVRN